MTYIWIHETSMSRFVNDRDIPPCQECGKYLGDCEYQGKHPKE